MTNIIKLPTIFETKIITNNATISSGCDFKQLLQIIKLHAHQYSNGTSKNISLIVKNNYPFVAIKCFIRFDIDKNKKPVHVWVDSNCAVYFRLTNDSKNKYLTIAEILTITNESIDNINEGKIAQIAGGVAIVAASLLGSITGAQAEPVQVSASEVSGLTQEDIKGFAAALSMDEQRIVDAIENNDVGVMMKILKNVKDSLSGKITVFENAIKEIQSGKWRADLEESLERDMAEMSPEEQAEVKSKLTKENLDKLEESYLVINQGMLKFSLELPKIYDQMLAQYEQHKDKFASVRESVILENSSNQLFDKVRQIIQYGHKIINSPQARLVKKYCRGTPVGQILASVK